MPLIPTDRIFGPRELHGIATARQYRTLVKRTMAKGRAAYPALTWPPPHDVPLQPPHRIVVNRSRWQVPCDCGNYPLYDPEWQIAGCLDCGAIYVGPPPRLWRQLRDLLLARPRLENRNWVGEPLDVILAENVANGVGAPA